MRLSLDVKPIGAFIEYTLKPLIDYSRDLLELAKEQGIAPPELIDKAMKIYVADMIVRSITQVIVTALICLTALACLDIKI